MFEIYIALLTCKMITEHFITNNTAIGVGSMILHNGTPELYL